MRGELRADGVRTRTGMLMAHKKAWSAFAWHAASKQTAGMNAKEGKAWLATQRLCWLCVLGAQEATRVALLLPATCCLLT